MKRYAPNNVASSKTEAATLAVVRMVRRGLRSRLWRTNPVQDTVTCLFYGVYGLTRTNLLNAAEAPPSEPGRI
jgi:hypothetical protein